MLHDSIVSRVCVRESVSRHHSQLFLHALDSVITHLVCLRVRTHLLKFHDAGKSLVYPSTELIIFIIDFYIMFGSLRIHYHILFVLG